MVISAGELEISSEQNAAYRLTRRFLFPICFQAVEGGRSGVRFLIRDTLWRKARNSLILISGYIVVLPDF